MRRSRASVDTPDPPCHYEVIGEHLGDPTHLLVIAEDGHFYALDLIDGLTPVPILNDEWVLDACDLGEKLASVGLT